MSRAIRAHEITARPVGVSARLHMEAHVEHAPEGRRMFYITIRAMAKTHAGQTAEVGRLTAWHSVYPNLSQSLLDPGADGHRMLDEFDEVSYDAWLGLEGLLAARPALAKRLRDRIEKDAPNSLIYIEQVAVHPAMRGQGLGLELIRALRNQLCASGALAFLKAIPIDTPYEISPSTDEERGAMLSDTQGTSALVRYYRSDRQLGFQKPSSKSKPDLLAAAWAPFEVTAPLSMSALLPADIFSAS